MAIIQPVSSKALCLAMARFWALILCQKYTTVIKSKFLYMPWIFVINLQKFKNH